MPYTSLIGKQIIIGYDLLPQKIQKEFEISESGQQFIKIVENYSLFLQKLKSPHWLTSYFSSNHENNEQLIQTELKKQQRELELRISEKKEYQKLVMQIIHSMLEKEIEEFQLLTKTQQEFLSRIVFSKKLLNTLASLDLQIEQDEQAMQKQGIVSIFLGRYTQLEDHVNQLKAKRTEAISLWKKEFSEQPSMAGLRKTIEERKEAVRRKQLERKKADLVEHIKQLSAYFPLLKYRKMASEEPILNQVIAKYSTENGELVADSNTVDEELLTDLLFYCMRQMSEIEISFMNLDEFNKKNAHCMALDILKGFNKKTKLNLDTWFLEYEEKLYQHITEQLLLINGKKWEESFPAQQDLLQSLSFLWNNPAVNTANEFLRKIADAHGFIQATSFSTQNENSYLVILDIYNYARHYEQISEARTVLTNLFSPLLPIYDEYKDIALHEKNVYVKFFRIIMPIVIVVAMIILISVILSPLALPELAFAAAFIPALLIGLAVTTGYVSVKNDIYKSIREWYYGGLYEIPEYQINQRMVSAFGTEQAQNVRNYYINEIKKCDDLEVLFSEKHAQGVLSQEGLDLRKANIQKRHQLNLEWYDIHSNNDLNYKKAPVIVAGRLQQSCDHQYQELKKSLEKETQSIRQSVAEVTHDLKETIIKHNIESSNQPKDKTEAPTIKANYRYGLFTPPHALEIKERMEECVRFKAQVSLAVGWTL